MDWLCTLTLTPWRCLLLGFSNHCIQSVSQSVSKPDNNTLVSSRMADPVRPQIHKMTQIVLLREGSKRICYSQLHNNQSINHSNQEIGSQFVNQIDDNRASKSVQSIKVELCLVMITSHKYIGSSLTLWLVPEWTTDRFRSDSRCRPDWPGSKCYRSWSEHCVTRRHRPDRREPIFPSIVRTLHLSTLWSWQHPRW